MKIFHLIKKIIFQYVDPNEDPHPKKKKKKQTEAIQKQLNQYHIVCFVLITHSTHI
jgi:hypothetical protein